MIGGDKSLCFSTKLIAKWIAVESVSDFYKGLYENKQNISTTLYFKALLCHDSNTLHVLNNTGDI